MYQQYQKWQLQFGKKGNFVLEKVLLSIVLPASQKCIPTLGPLLLLRHDAVVRILANGSAAFFESCAAIGWKDCDSVRLL